jgi:hypothetical protein
MLRRRQLLQGLGALPFLPLIDHREASTLVAGSVTNPTGTVSGQSLTGLQDAYAGNFGGLICPAGGVQAQWNHVVLLSSQANACTTGNPYSSNEVTIRLVLWAFNELPDCAGVYPPSGDLPLTFTVQDVQQTTSDSVTRAVRAYYMKAKATGGLGNDVAATGGTVTFTRMDNVQYEGSYSLTFPSSGSAAVDGFVAPWCGTAP